MKQVIKHKIVFTKKDRQLISSALGEKAADLGIQRGEDSRAYVYAKNVMNKWDSIPEGDLVLKNFKVEYK